LYLALALVLGTGGSVSGAPAKKAATQPKSQKQLEDMLDSFERTAPPTKNYASRHRLPPARPLPMSAYRRAMPMPTQGRFGGMGSGMGGNPAMMQMLQQQMQSGAGPQGNAAFMQMLQRMQSRGRQPTAGQQSGFMQMLQQRLQGAGGAAGRPPSAPMMQPPMRGSFRGAPAAPMMTAPKQPSFGSFSPVPAKAPAATTGGGQDLEKLMESQYGH
jgi:hypothetical protein